MNEKEVLLRSNPWINSEDMVLNDIYVTQDVSKWVLAHDILLSTDDNDHVMEYRTLLRILDVMPDSLSWNGKFALGVTLGDDWKMDLQKLVRHRKGKICFLNFAKHGLIENETQVYLDAEKEKVHLIREFLLNAKIKLLHGDKEVVMYSSADPKKNILVGCPPNKCDILITRPEFVDALPSNCFKRYVNPKGFMIHFGRPKKPIVNGNFVAIDSNVIETFKKHDKWIDSFVEYVAALNT
tara:strand:+ start:3398 stop:4114 length:717 start_codon:yes stop_codon:yes gene_type:complete